MDGIQPSITCPECLKVSYNYEDVKNKFCGTCGYHSSPISEFLVQNGYTHIKYIEGFGWCALKRFMYTVGVLHGLTVGGVTGRFCFDTMDNAKLFLDDLAANGTKAKMPIVGLDGCTAIK